MKGQNSQQQYQQQNTLKEDIKKLMQEVIKEFFGSVSITFLFLIIFLITFVITLVDYYNLPSIFIINHQIPFFAISGAVITTLLLWLYENHFLKVIKTPALSQLDYVAFLTAIVSILYFILRSQISGISLSLLFPSAMFISCVLLLCYRFHVRVKALREYNSRNINVFSLKELLMGTCSRVNGRPILLEEKAVDYDLIDREEIIDKLYQTLIHCVPKESYVIALEGNWGAGKTTILNNVKKRIENPENGHGDIKIINDFDPWIYGSQEAMLSALFNKLMCAVGVSPKSGNNKKMLREILDTMIGELATTYHVGGLIRGARAICSATQHIGSIKVRLSSYLKTTNKKFVFFIDNLDRANNDNIVLLFKIMGTIFDLPGVVFVISYEKDRIESALKETQNIDPRYSEKIIQRTITVPEVMTNSLERTYMQAISNLLKMYEVQVEELPALSKIMDYICSINSNIRDFIRMINTVFTTVFSSKTNLNIQDLFIIELLHFYEPNLYMKIFENRDFFIYQGKDSVSINRFFMAEKYINDAENLFHSIKESHIKASELLAELFPLFKLYYLESSLKKLDRSKFSEDDVANIEHRMYDGRYFEMYFTYSPTSYAHLYNKVLEFLNAISSIFNSQLVQEKLERNISGMISSDQIKWFAIMRMNLDKVSTKNLLYLTIAIFNLVQKRDSTNHKIIISDYNPISYIASALLHCDVYTVNEFYSSINAKIYLDTVGSIYHFALQENRNSDNEESIINIMKAQYRIQCEPILKEKIDIFEGEKYHCGNSIGLYRYCLENNLKDEFKEYISVVQTSSNIYRILLDTVSYSQNIGEYDYAMFIDDERFRGYFKGRDTIDKCILEHGPTSEDEQFIKELYLLYCTNKKNILGEPVGLRRATNEYPFI